MLRMKTAGTKPGGFLLRRPEPHDGFRYDVTDREQRRRPNEGGHEIRNLELPKRHFENTGDQRHGSPQRPKEPADKNSDDAPLLHEGFAARNEFGMAR